MTMKKILLSVAAISALANTLSADAVNDRFNELEERLDKVETSSLTDKIDFGLTFRTRYDAVNYDNAKVEDDGVFTTKLNLNMKSKISNDVKFTGRLTGYEVWGGNYDNMYSGYNAKQGRVANGTGLFMERAYVDWAAIKGDVPVTLTIGRQPSSDGPSWQFAENSVRKGTYDALLFDGASDGIVATVGLSKLVGNEGTAFRVAYGKGVENESYKNAGYDNSAYANSGLKDNVVYGAFLETSIPALADSLVNLSYAKATDIIGDSNVQGAGWTPSKNMGDMTFTGVMFELPEVTKGLDLFAHYGHSKATANGKTVAMDLNGDGGKEQDVTLLDGSGHAYWLGARYAVTPKVKLGYEWNKGSEKWFSMTSGSIDPYNKLATRGTVNDAYVVFDVAKATHIKFGYMVQDFDYTGSGYHITQPMAISTAKSFDAAMGTNTVEKVKNTYVEFVVNF